MLLLKRTLKIMAICLAVGALLLLRRPPGSGNAAISGFEEDLLQGVPEQRGPENEAQQEGPSVPKDNQMPEAKDALAVRVAPQSQPADETAAREALGVVSTAGKQTRDGAQKIEPPVGVVDARNCVGLNYGQVMQGAVSVKMVWNGYTFVPQKVCIVKEGTSAASVWSFEQSSGAIVSELRAGSKTPEGPAGK